MHACSRLSGAKTARGEGAHLGVEDVANRRPERVLSPVLIPCVLAFLLWCVAVQSQSGSELSVKITSPLGRMGEPGTVRIVGQVRPAPGRSVAAVRFSVDGALLGTVTNGPPVRGRMDRRQPFSAARDRRRSRG